MPNPDAILDSPQQARMRSVSHALCTAFANLPESSLSLLAATLSNVGEPGAAHAVRQFAKESVAGVRVPELWAEDVRTRARAAIAVPLAEHVRELRGELESLRDGQDQDHACDDNDDWNPAGLCTRSVGCAHDHGHAGACSFDDGDTSLVRDERRNTRGL